MSTLQHCAVVTGPEHDDFTVSASVFCEFYAFSPVDYGFRAFRLDGEELTRMSGTYSEVRCAWEIVAGGSLPHWIDQRRV